MVFSGSLYSYGMSTDLGSIIVGVVDATTVDSDTRWLLKDAKDLNGVKQHSYWWSVVGFYYGACQRSLVMKNTAFVRQTSLFQFIVDAFLANCKLNV